MKVESVLLSDLYLDPKNARVGDVTSIRESLLEFGQHRPVVAQKGTGKIIAGNHLYKAAKQLGWDEISVYWVEDDDITAIRRGIADNATGDRSEWDLEVLGELLEMTGVDIPGLDVDSLFKEDAAPIEKPKPKYAIAPKMDESSNSVVIHVESDLDWALIATALGFSNEQICKSEGLGQVAVLKGADFLGWLKSR